MLNLWEFVARIAVQYAYVVANGDGKDEAKLVPGGRHDKIHGVHEEGGAHLVRKVVKVRQNGIMGQVEDLD